MHLFAIKKGAQQPMDLISFRLSIVAVVGLIDPELLFNPLFLKSKICYLICRVIVAVDCNLVKKWDLKAILTSNYQFPLKTNA